MHDLITLIVPSLASGLITAVGAYIAIVWKLSKRVDQLEMRQTSLEANLHQQDKWIKATTDDIRNQIIKMSEKSSKDLADVLTAIHLMEEHINGFKLTCAETRGRVVTCSAFAEFTRDQQEKWDQMNRMWGRLEEVMRMRDIPPTKK